MIYVYFHNSPQLKPCAVSRWGTNLRTALNLHAEFSFNSRKPSTRSRNVLNVKMTMVK